MAIRRRNRPVTSLAKPQPSLPKRSAAENRRRGKTVIREGFTTPSGRTPKKTSSRTKSAAEKKSHPPHRPRPPQTGIRRGMSSVRTSTLTRVRRSSYGKESNRSRIASPKEAPEGISQKQIREDTKNRRTVRGPSAQRSTANGAEREHQEPIAG
jgi:hypothetical protein